MHKGEQHAHAPGRRRSARLSSRTAASAVAAALAVGAAGCAHPGPPAARSTAGSTPVLLQTADLRLPLDDYLLSLAEGTRLTRAARVLVSECMRGLGLSYAAAEPGPSVGPRTWNERRYGLTDPAQAARGYWPDNRAAAARPRRPTNATAEEGAAVSGRTAVVNGHPVPPGGCGAQAQRRLAAQDPAGTDKYLAQRLSTDSFFGSRQDPAVRAATARWSACMAAAGYRYAGPLDPPADRRFQGAGSALESATATADVACKRQTNLVGVWFAAESGRQRTQIEQNRPALQLARAAFEAELAVAVTAGA